MIFKANWEKTEENHRLPSHTVEEMIELIYPGKTLISFELISGGCANINFNIRLQGIDEPLILRIYLRDKDAAYREQKLANLLCQSIPVPKVHNIGDFQGFRFGIVKHIPGITLRELMLSGLPHDLNGIMFTVGQLLSRITSHKFPKAGFFDKELNVSTVNSQGDYQIFARECLKSQIVLTQLDSEMISKICLYINKYHYLYPDGSERNLVHADFDPANILVDQTSGQWRVSGILDWEFSFSGSVLCDVANMLRYAHQMPQAFEYSFLEGLKAGGVCLPENWKMRIHMLNLLSLLDCLARGNPIHRPNQCIDICELIDYILKYLNNEIEH
ncbi:MAG: aminoglycoside phosphotransferase family protein [Waddliaceae bacterium]